MIFVMKDHFVFLIDDPLVVGIKRFYKPLKTFTPKLGMLP